MQRLIFYYEWQVLPEKCFRENRVFNFNTQNPAEKWVA